MEIKNVGNFDGIELYRLSDGDSFVEIMTYGARIHKLCVPDRFGDLQDVVLGFENPCDYRGDNPYFNAVVGRVANRIGGARFTLDGKEYKLSANERGNQLHGGFEGFDRKIFTAQILSDGLELSYVSKDGEEGYPSELCAKVKYSFENNALKIEYTAYTDGKTHCNLTNHAYFNLNGDFSPVTNHVFIINSNCLTDIDSELIPNGYIVDVSDSILDLTQGRVLSDCLKYKQNKLMNIGGGFDFNYIFRNNFGAVCSVWSPKSGIFMNVYTDRPCVQFYSGNFLDGTIKGKATFVKHSGFALETQGFPNACNVPCFPTTLLEKGETFHTETTYSFEIKD